MAVPKRKMSRSNTRPQAPRGPGRCPQRRAQWKATPPDLVPITIDGRPYRVPRPLVRAYQRRLLRPED